MSASDPNTMKDAEQRVLDGQVWDDFCDSIKAAGKLLDSPKAPQDAFNRAEGYRYLTRMLRAGLESFLEFSDKDFPVLRCGCHETIKLGADNPDNYYQSAPINPEHDYRIVGDRNTVPYLSISTVDNQYSKGKGMEVTGFIDADDMHVDANGRIEIILSRTEKPGNWLPMTDQTNQITVRQTFQDRKNEQRAELVVQRVDAGRATPDPLTAERLVRGLEGASRFLNNTPRIFEDWAESMLPFENTLPHGDQSFFQMLGGDPNIHYLHSTWRLADDEILLLEAPVVPECDTWNFQLDNWWMESLDYVNHQIHFNKSTATYEKDGGVKVLVSHTDPGHPNWIDTAGHRDGTMCWRWIGASEHPDVNATVMKLADYKP